MFDRAIRALREGYLDSTFTRDSLTRLSEEHRPAAYAASGPAAEREIIWRMLTRIPLSHLTLLSRDGYTALMRDVWGRKRMMLGVHLIQIGSRYFAAGVLNGAPADLAGVKEWDEIVRIDEQPPGQSPHVDQRSDDAYLNDERDPPAYGLHVPGADTLRLGFVRTPGETLTVRFKPTPYSTLDANRASVRLTTRNGVRIGYIHWWYMNLRGIPAALDSALDGPLAASEALVLDLRGRGGSFTAVQDVLQRLSPGSRQRFQGPIVALIDRRTRSAKEQLAYELRARGLARLIGEPTAGAYLPADFAELGLDVILMFPGAKTYTYYVRRIERQPVVPDVPVAGPGPYAAGHDPLFEAGVDEAVRLVTERGPGRIVRNR